MPISSASCNFNWKPKDFHLYDLNEKRISFYESFGKKGLVVLFICNHCPYVQSIEKKIKYETDKLKDIGVNSIAIMSNDQDHYEEDSNLNLRKQLSRTHFNFPYLLDLDQNIAQLFNALCTPDFFGFNSLATLQYRGRLDSLGKDAEMGNRELYDSMKDIAENNYTNKPQFPSMGCSIRWKL